MKARNENDLNSINIVFFKNLTKDSYTNGFLDNTFIVFKDINDILYLIYSNRKSIISYNLINFQKINQIKDAHNEEISNFRHHLDKVNKRDLLLSLSKIDNNIQIWNAQNFECLFNIRKVNIAGYLYSSCFLNDKNKIYIITSNWNLTIQENIKVFNLKGKIIKKIKDSNDLTFFIDNYYDKKIFKNYIITSNQNYLKSYDFNNNKIYHKYDDNDIYEHSNLIIYEKKNLVQIIESSLDKNIRVWNFNSGQLIYKSSIITDCELYGICLWDDEHIFIGCEDKTIKYIELKSGIIHKNLINHLNKVISIKKINHPIYGECLISQGRGYDQIRMWVNKDKII